MIYQNYSNLLFMIKRENVSMKRKRIQCNNHGKPFKYHCENSTCQAPYLCGQSDCIDGHFHEDQRLVLTKFDSKLWESKFQQVENVLNNQTLKVKEEHLTKLVDYFTQTLQRIRQEMSKFQQVKSKICEAEESNVTPQYFESINGFLSMGCKLQRKIDSLRAKIIDEDISFQDRFEESPINHHNHIEINESNNASRENEAPRPVKNKLETEKNGNNHPHSDNHDNQMIDSDEDDEPLKLPPRKHTEYYENRYLTAFLKTHISNFQWSSSQIVFSSQSHLTTCQKFHQKLRDRRNLLFLFIGEQEIIIGSYYTQPYPSIAEKVRKDVNSFIFISDRDLAQKFAIFHADSQSEQHMAVSEKLLICQGNTPNNGDGLRAFKRNFQSLDYFLPSISFKNLNTSRDVNYNGILKVKEFYILQVLKE